MARKRQLAAAAVRYQPGSAESPCGRGRSGAASSATESGEFDGRAPERDTDRSYPTRAVATSGATDGADQTPLGWDVAFIALGLALVLSGLVMTRSPAGIVANGAFVERRDRSHLCKLEWSP